MATQLPIKYFKTIVNNVPEVVWGAWPNRPVGHEEINYETAQSLLRSQGKLDRLAQLPATGAPSGYVIGPNGNLMDAKLAENYAPSPQESARGIVGTGQYAGQTYDQINATLPKAPMQITLGNGQVVSVDKNGNFSDAQGNPITNTQVAGAKAGTPAITSTSLSSTTPFTPVQSTYNPSGVNSIMTGLQQSVAQQQAQMEAQYKNTPQQQKESDLNTMLQGLINQDAGRAAEQTQQETAFGVDTKTAAVNDLQSQLQTILNEHAAAQLATQQGQGVTTNIDRRQRDEETRLSAIKALSISSLIAAANGNLSYAQSQADRAVKTKYAPIEAQIKAATANLQLIKNDPTSTNQEKRQADQQLAIQQQMKDAVAQAKQNSSDILKIAAEAASNGADSLTLQRIQNSPDGFSALQAAGRFMAPPVKPSAGGTTTTNAIDSGQPVVVPADPTKTTAQNNMQTLQQVFQSSKVSAGNKTSIGNGLALAQAAQDLANANPDGKFSGFSPFRAVTDITIPFTGIGLPFREALKRNKTIENESLISALDLQTQFWASGAALSDAQTALVKKMIPTVNNTDTQIRTKVNQLINYMLSQTASRLVTDGVDFKPAKVDMFETADLLGKVSPEQQAQLKAAGLIQ